MNVDELTRNVNCHQKSQLIKIMNSLWNFKLFVRCDPFAYMILDFKRSLSWEPFFIVDYFQYKLTKFEVQEIILLLKCRWLYNGYRRHLPRVMLWSNLRILFFYSGKDEKKIFQKTIVYFQNFLTLVRFKLYS